MAAYRIMQLISSGGYYGAENMVTQLCLALAKDNHHVTLGVFHNAHRPNTSIADEARVHGLQVELIPCSGRLDRRTIQGVRKLLRTRQIDVLHTHGYKADIYGYFAAKNTSASLVATCHNWPGKTHALQLYAALDRFVLRRFCRIGAVSVAVEDSLKRSGIAPARICLVENG